MTLTKACLTTLATLTLLSFNISCSKSEPKQKPKAAEITENTEPQPELKVEDFQRNGCLNLQQLQSYIGREEFNFPARQTIVSLKSDWRSSEFIKNNFSSQPFSFEYLPFFNEIEQLDCETIKIKNSYGQNLIYTIEESGRDFIYFTFDSIEGVDEIEEIYVEAMEDEPKYVDFKLSLPNSKTMEIEYTSEVIFPFCDSEKLYTYSKAVVLRWGKDRNTFPQNESIHRHLVEDVESILDSQPDIPEIILSSATSSARVNSSLASHIVFSVNQVHPADNNEDRHETDEEESESESTLPINAEEDESDEASSVSEARPQSEYVLMSVEQIAEIESQLSKIKVAPRCDVIN